MLVTVAVPHSDSGWSSFVILSGSFLNMLCALIIMMIHIGVLCLSVIVLIVSFSFRYKLGLPKWHALALYSAAVLLKENQANE
jgi:hypothetical protein